MIDLFDFSELIDLDLLEFDFDGFDSLDNDFDFELPDTFDDLLLPIIDPDEWI